MINSTVSEHFSILSSDSLKTPKPSYYARVRSRRIFRKHPIEKTRWNCWVYYIYRAKVTPVGRTSLAGYYCAQGARWTSLVVAGRCGYLCLLVACVLTVTVRFVVVVSGLGAHLFVSLILQALVFVRGFLRYTIPHCTAG
jgi:hypothetical protein